MAICSHFFSFLISQWAAMHPPNSFLSQDEKNTDCEHEQLLHDHRAGKKKQRSALKQATREVATGVATCCALCCCCPLAIVDILILALIQAPYRFGKKSFLKLRKKCGCLVHHHTHSTKDGTQEEEPLWCCEGDSAHWEGVHEAMGSSGSQDPVIISQAFLSAGGLTAGYTLTWQRGCATPRIPHKLVQKLLLGMRKKLHFKSKPCASSACPSASHGVCGTSMSLSDGGGSHESTPLWSEGRMRGKDCMTGYDSDFGLEWFTEPSNSQEGRDGPGFKLFWDDYLDKGEVGFWRPMYSNCQD